MVSTHPKVQTVMEKILIKMVDDMVANGRVMKRYNLYARLHCN